MACLSSKRRKGFPSETRVKRGLRFVRGGEKELIEKLGRNDLCPCGSGHSFQEMLPHLRPVSTVASGRIIGGNRVGRFGVLPDQLVHCHRNLQCTVTVIYRK